MYKTKAFRSSATSPLASATIRVEIQRNTTFRSRSSSVASVIPTCTRSATNGAA